MKLIIEIALKFLFGKKSKGIINVISTISIIGVSVGTIALLVILSVFNGLHGLIGSLYGSFDPDIKVTAVEGKFFSTDSLKIKEIKELDGVIKVSPVIEDNALLKYNNRQVTAMVMGVDSTFREVTQLDSIIVEGKFNLRDKQGFGGAIGYVLADQLNVRVAFLTPLLIYVPQRNKRINLNRPNEAFNTHYIHPKGIFLVKQMEYDSKYLLVDIDLVRKLFVYKDTEVTSLAIGLKEGSDSANIQEKIQGILGSGLKVENRHQQHASFYKMMRVERIMAYLILCFILIIATFNLIGTMSMLIFDKKEGIKILKSIGANKKMVTRIFLVEGWLISLIGVVAGLLIGIVLVLLQQHFGLIKFSGGNNFVVDAYPVALEIPDIFYSLITVTTIGFFAALYPVKIIVGKYFNENY
ncbi:ABC transporter permease [Plebeiibacterium sediminum]|uniref:FtsX-like permease family protein n=1 Tax=Plebeiibacterium sediminum TaxID=2992112 RepID=A0AAE3M8V8_9BACT|nr:FtsX-like permease family protein [Plebeiobacterium sediminum]MCW3788725.1 FtsX-like permease family protein [Plebeiobacterium sediminum]